MKFQIGDKVILLHSNEEAEIIDIINKEMVMVDVHGVKFPAYIDQLDFPYFKRFTEKKQDLTKTKNMLTTLSRKKHNLKRLQMESGLPLFLSLIWMSLAMNL